jgi:hypothetical protein
MNTIYDREAIRRLRKDRKEMMGKEPPGERGRQRGFKGRGGVQVGRDISMYFRWQNRIAILRIEFEPTSWKLALKICESEAPPLLWCESFDEMKSPCFAPRFFVAGSRY